MLVLVCVYVLSFRLFSAVQTMSNIFLDSRTRHMLLFCKLCVHVTTFIYMNVFYLYTLWVGWMGRGACLHVRKMRGGSVSPAVRTECKKKQTDEPKTWAAPLQYIFFNCLLILWSYFVHCGSDEENIKQYVINGWCMCADECYASKVDWWCRVFVSVNTWDFQNTVEKDHGVNCFVKCSVRFCFLCFFFSFFFFSQISDTACQKGTWIKNHCLETMVQEYCPEAIKVSYVPNT